jgi:hypothetical protein
MAKTPLWQRKAGQSKTGGLNAKGRAAYNRANNANLKAPTKSKTSKFPKAARNPNSRLRLARKKWGC